MNALRSEIILVVDDESDVRSTVCEILHRAGFSTMEATSGRVALEIMERSTPDIVLMDLNMPDMTGREVCETIRKTRNEMFLPIVLMSGSDPDDSLVRGLAAGANDFIGKPFKIDVLLAKIESLLRTKRDFGRTRHEAPFERGRCRKEVAVAFVDLRGFTAFSDSFDLDHVTEVLDEYYREIGRESFLWKGTIGGLSGDGVLIFFNRTDEINNLEAAIQFALGTRLRLSALQKNWNDRSYELGFGIGIAGGEVQIGQIGFEGHQDYTVIGSVPNLAARLSSEARANQILVSESSLNQLRERLVIEKIGPVLLKGFKNQLEVCNILSLILPSYLCI